MAIGALSSSPTCLEEGFGDSRSCSSSSVCLSSSPVPSSNGELPLLPLLIAPLDFDPLSDKTSEEGEVPCKRGNRSVCRTLDL